MSYCSAKDCWAGLAQYNLSGKKSLSRILLENYVPPVTLSLPEWQQYVASGKNVLLGSGGVIPGGTYATTIWRRLCRISRTCTAGIWRYGIQRYVKLI